jgi:hypothetical protein
MGVRDGTSLVNRCPRDVLRQEKKSPGKKTAKDG